MEQATNPRIHRVRVFVDFWNLQLAFNNKEPTNSRIDWEIFPRWVATRGVQLALNDDTVQPEFEGAHIYISYNPRSPQDVKLKQWAATWLDRQPGIQVVLRERVPRYAPRCQNCHRLIEECPHCGGRLAGTVEKGVDTALGLISSSWRGRTRTTGRCSFLPTPTSSLWPSSLRRRGGRSSTGLFLRRDSTCRVGAGPFWISASIAKLFAEGLHDYLARDVVGRTQGMGSTPVRLAALGLLGENYQGLLNS